jgi:putative FmdB family regulatory protein
MPIYEYQCKACGHEQEVLQKMNAEPLIHCPACNKPELMKKISAAGFRLKGNGWYETDFKSGKKRNVVGEIKKPDKSGGNKTGSSKGDSSSNHSSSTAGEK